METPLGNACWFFSSLPTEKYHGPNSLTKNHGVISFGWMMSQPPATPKRSRHAWPNHHWFFLKTAVFFVPTKVAVLLAHKIPTRFFPPCSSGSFIGKIQGRWPNHAGEECDCDCISHGKSIEIRWWLNQPIWKICLSNWIISPGMKIENIFETTT